LNTWHGKGLHTAEEILAAEKPVAAKGDSQSNYASTGSANAERDHMRRLLQELNKES